MKYLLIHEKTGKAAKEGDRVVSFRGEPANVVGWWPPQSENSSGHVLVREYGGRALMRYYPCVYGLKFECVADPDDLDRLASEIDADLGSLGDDSIKESVRLLLSANNR